MTSICLHSGCPLGENVGWGSPRGRCWIGGLGPRVELGWAGLSWFISRSVNMMDVYVRHFHNPFPFHSSLHPLPTDSHALSPCHNIRYDSPRREKEKYPIQRREERKEDRVGQRKRRAQHERSGGQRGEECYNGYGGGDDRCLGKVRDSVVKRRRLRKGGRE